jgi:hypothetical protein
MYAQNKVGMKTNMEALNQQLAMNLLLQQPTMFGQMNSSLNKLNPNLNQLNFILNQNCMMQMAQFNNASALSMNSQNSPAQMSNTMTVPQGLWMPNQNLNLGGDLQYQPFQPAYNHKIGVDSPCREVSMKAYILQNPLLIQPKANKINRNYGEQTLHQTLHQNLLLPEVHANLPKETFQKSLNRDSNLNALKLNSERKSSFSTENCTQDAEKAATESSKTTEFESVTSLVFNIRRYSKKQKKYILLTRHRKLITKCKHTDDEYYAKGMCKKCYHNKGERGKFAYSCGHNNDYHYARGMCKRCYLTEYHNNRKLKISK